MRDFKYARAKTRQEAVALAQGDGTMFLAGGTELLNWARIGIADPARVVDINRVPDMEGVTKLSKGGVRIGALTRLNDLAMDRIIAKDYPVLSQALLKAASPQIRNLATIGGNPLQKSRCSYFRSEAPTPCNRRNPGSGCSAIAGYHSRHAIFGWTNDCVCVHPADPPVALCALDAEYITEGPVGGRRIPASDLNVLPGVDPAKTSILRDGELIVAIEMPAPAPKSAYLKVRERESYEYALVSAAVALDMNGSVIRRARIALGSVAMKPWRLTKAEAAIVGQSPTSDAIRDAVGNAMADAEALPQTEYKITLARNAAVRAIEMAARA